MYSLCFFVIFCLFAYLLNRYKNQKLNRSKTTINLMFESILQVMLSYTLVIVSLRLIKDISILHTVNSIWENRLKFTIKFNTICFVYLVLFLVLSFIFKYI